MIAYRTSWSPGRCTRGMSESIRRSAIVGESASYKGHRYPGEIIAHCVWLYHRFPLSFREVEELMLARGVVVSYETIRAWCAKFGQAYANQLRRRRPRPGDKWHLDEVFVNINGTSGIPVACGRPARQRVGRLGPATPKRGGRQAVLPPAAQGPAVRAAGHRHRRVEQLPGRAPRDRAVGGPSPVEVSEQSGRELHQPTRQRERAMKRFKSPGTRNGSCPLSRAFRLISVRVGICCRRPNTDR